MISLVTISTPACDYTSLTVVKATEKASEDGKCVKARGVFPELIWESLEFYGSPPVLFRSNFPFYFRFQNSVLENEMG